MPCSFSFSTGFVNPLRHFVDPNPYGRFGRQLDAQRRVDRRLRAAERTWKRAAPERLLQAPCACVEPRPTASLR